MGVKPNPNFKGRIARINTVEDQRKQQDKDALTLAERVKKFTADKKQKKQDAKEFRQNTVGTLGEVTERFIQQGFDEDTAFREAKNIIDEVDSDPNFQAKNGFMGTLNFSTIFTVGEGNKKEFVNVFNVSDKLSGFPSAVNTKEKFINKKKSKKKNNNIFDVGF